MTVHNVPSEDSHHLRIFTVHTSEGTFTDIFAHVVLLPCPVWYTHTGSDFIHYADTRTSELFACWVILHAFLSTVVFFLKVTFSKKNLQEYHQSVKQFGSRSGQTFCPAWSGSLLFAMVISRQQKWPLAEKELIDKVLFSTPYFFSWKLCCGYSVKTSH